MATAVQKNGMKPLSNGNSLIVHHDVQEIQGITELSPYSIVEQCKEGYAEQCLDNYSKVENYEQKYGTVEGDLQESQTTEAESEPEIDIVINNVVCSFSVRCHLNLREIALSGMNVEYRRENGMITMKLRRPYTTASIWSSGKVTCTGATSEDQAKVAARRFARLLQKLGFKVCFNNYRVVNVLGTCSMPFAIKINSFSERHKEADYEPELHPGVTYKLKVPKATLKIFSTGSVTVTGKYKDRFKVSRACNQMKTQQISKQFEAPSVADVQSAIEHIFPLVYEFRKERTPEDLSILQAAKRRRMAASVQSVYDPPCKVAQQDEESECETEETW